VVILKYPYIGIDSHADNALSNPLGEGLGPMGEYPFCTLNIFIGVSGLALCFL